MKIGSCKIKILGILQIIQSANLSENLELLDLRIFLIFAQIIGCNLISSKEKQENLYNLNIRPTLTIQI